MPNFSRNELILVRYPFSDLSDFKVRPAIVVNGTHPSSDIVVVALTSKTERLMPGEFVLRDWRSCGLNVETAVKRGIFTIHEKLILKSLGSLAESDANNLDMSLRGWLDL